MSFPVMPVQALVVYERDELIGRLRYKWGTPTTIHVVSLVTRQHPAIWRLKRQLDALPWTQIMFKRRKLAQRGHPSPWRYYFRRPVHVQ